MKIDRIDVIPFGVPIRDFADAYTGFSVSNAVLVKIYTDEGHVGYGEACAWEPEFYGETLESAVLRLKSTLLLKLLEKIPGILTKFYPS